MKFYLSLFFLISVVAKTLGQHTECQPLGWAGDQVYPDLPIEIPGNIHNLVNHKLSNTQVKIRVAIEENGVFPYGNGADFELDFYLGGRILDHSGAPISTTNFNERITLSQTQPEAIYSLNIPAPNLLNPGSPNPYSLTSNVIYALDDLTVSGTTVSGARIPTELQNPQTSPNIIVEVCYELDLGIDIGWGASTSFFMIEPNLRAIPQLVSGSSYYEFQWDASSPSNVVHTNNSFYNVYSPFYEFQLLKLENTALEQDDLVNEKHIKTKVDWSKALSFIIPEEKLMDNGIYKLKFRPSEGEGYYLWRIRPMGNYYDGGLGHNLNWGKWSEIGYPVDAQGYTELTAATSFDCFYFADPDKEDNYIYSRTFTEDGQVYENMTYADKLLRPRQTQGYLPAEGKTIVGQTLYDHLGRSSIAVMPVPVDGYMNGYREKHVKSATTNELYKLEDYATDDKLYNPDRVSNVGDHSYYSDQNPDQTIPDAQGYPFTRSIYSNDGLGRVTEQSGVGKTHMVGTRAAGRGRTTTTDIQVGVEDAELVSIFGAEAPNPANVSKQVVTDPNGTTSITYTSKSGKTLATALAEPYDPDGDYPLESVQDPASPKVNTLQLTEALHLGQYQNDRFVNSKQLILSQDVPNFQINYVPPGCSGGGTNLPLCLASASSCSYEVTVTIKKVLTTGNDPDWGTLIDPEKFKIEVFQHTETSVSGCTPVSMIPIGTTLNLRKGTYEVIKEVKVLGNSLSNKIDDYLAETEKQVLAYMELIGILLDQVEKDEDWIDVGTAVGHVQTYLGTSRTAAEQAILEAALDGVFQGAFTSFDFIQLGSPVGFPTQIVVDMIYTGNLTSSVDEAEVDEIKLILHNCDGDPTEISSEIQKKKRALNIGQQAPYTYAPNDGSAINFDYPPFLEYFLDNGGLDLPASDFSTYFNGYKYWNWDNSAWEQMDATFLTKYTTALNAIPVDNDALKILNANQFNRMIWHMLNDEYYPNSVQFDDDPVSPTFNEYIYFDPTANANAGAWLKLDAAALATLRETQYDVNELIGCWTNIVSVFSKLLDNRSAISMPSDMDATIDNDAGSGSYMDEVNNNIPWIIRFLFGDKLNQNMTNDQNNNGAQPVFSNIPLSPSHLPQRFLECAGAKYARLIDEVSDADARTHINTTTQHSPAASMAFNTFDVPLVNGTLTSIGSAGYQQTVGGSVVTIPGYADEIAEYYGEREGFMANHEDHLIPELPFIQNPVFAFKYYEYWGRNAPGTLSHPWDGVSWTDPVFPFGTKTLLLSNIDKPFSCLTCESAYSYSETATNACNSSNSSHDEWNFGQRKLFLNCIQDIQNDWKMGYPEGATIINSNTISLDKSNCAATDAGITAEINGMVDACEVTCENRRDEFRKEVVEMFQRACWGVGQCSTQNVNYVTAAEVEAVVDQLVLKCKGQCAVTPPTPINRITCVHQVGGVNIEYCLVPALDECELMLKNIAEYWKIELHIDPPAGVTCSGNEWNTPLPTGSDPEACTPSGAANSTINQTNATNLPVPAKP
ncbi:DUF6443 domain-containing protein [Aureispira anguillae]|uniref:DUF6443 domain-containing protein n=1 Tax=Aureispira anguillae TaxID=2864201 RepID=A0A915YCE7_9BACT|nr:DUF6443 domain-containing protein [Aureispira anguillae]BDS10489.1 hypothetical protein AsAng_0011970 [Aureispira anguillae]